MSNLDRLKRISLIRKGWDLCKFVPRILRAIRLKSYGPGDLPPILINSLPKSGTHLLMQVIESIPQYKWYGTFIASTPSVTMRLRSERDILKKINGLVNGEIACGHIHYSDNILEALRKKNVITLFIYRDPRAVFWSEMQYLLNMNRWHRAGRYARKISNLSDRFRFFIKGFDGNLSPPFWWPRFHHRVDPYVSWIKCPYVCAMSYEDLGSEQMRRGVCVNIAKFVRERAGVLRSIDIGPLVSKMISNINPVSSHTYREGNSEAWRLGLSKPECDMLNREIFDLVESITVNNANNKVSSVG